LYHVACVVDGFVNVVLAEQGLILPEAQAPQPHHDVHDGAPQSVVACIIGWGSQSVQGSVGVLRASQSPLRSNGNVGL
jgi:hypothetical protein